MSIVKEAKEVLEWIESKTGMSHPIYMKQKMIVTSLDGIKSQFSEQKKR